MRGVLGAFRELDATVSAIEALKKKNVGIIRVYTPTPRHELEEAIVAPPSPVRRFTLIGGLAGVTFGYWIAIWTSDYWPLVVGGKPIASWVPSALTLVTAVAASTRLVPPRMNPWVVATAVPPSATNNAA